jgi:hypothetical protein
MMEVLGDSFLGEAVFGSILALLVWLIGSLAKKDIRRRRESNGY